MEPHSSQNSNLKDYVDIHKLIIDIPSNESNPSSNESFTIDPSLVNVHIDYSFWPGDEAMNQRKSRKRKTSPEEDIFNFKKKFTAKQNRYFSKENLEIIKATNVTELKNENLTQKLPIEHENTNTSKSFSLQDDFIPLFKPETEIESSDENDETIGIKNDKYHPQISTLSSYIGPYSIDCLTAARSEAIETIKRKSPEMKYKLRSKLGIKTVFDDLNQSESSIDESFTIDPNLANVQIDYSFWPEYDSSEQKMTNVIKETVEKTYNFRNKFIDEQNLSNVSRTFKSIEYQDDFNGHDTESSDNDDEEDEYLASVIKKKPVIIYNPQLSTLNNYTGPYSINCLIAARTEALESIKNKNHDMTSVLMKKVAVKGKIYDDAQFENKIVKFASQVSNEIFTKSELKNGIFADKNNKTRSKKRTVFDEEKVERVKGIYSLIHKHYIYFLMNFF